MNKKEFIRRAARRAGGTIVDATIFYEAFMEELAEAMENEEKVLLQGVGTMRGIVKKAHVFHNIKTNQNEMAPAKKTIQFTPSDVFIKSMNQ